MNRSDKYDSIMQEYDGFADALILSIGMEFDSTTAISKGKAIVHLRAMSQKLDYEYEAIILVFSGVLSFRFTENEKTSSTVINRAKLLYDGQTVSLDFFPILRGGKLVPNPDSDFIIRAKSFSLSKTSV